MLFGCGSFGNRVLGSSLNRGTLENDIDSFIWASREESGTPEEVSSRIEEEQARLQVFKAREDALAEEISASLDRGGAVSEKANVFRMGLLGRETAFNIAERERVRDQEVNAAWPERRKQIYLDAVKKDAAYSEKGLTPEGKVYAPSGGPIASPLLQEAPLAADDPLATENTRNLALVLGATLLLAFLVVRM